MNEIPGDPELLAMAMDAGIPSTIAHEILKMKGPGALQQAIDEHAHRNSVQIPEPDEG